MLSGPATAGEASPCAAPAAASYAGAMITVSSDAAWARQDERGSGVALAALLWLALRLGPARMRLALPPLVLWFLLTSPDARAASGDYLRRVFGSPARWTDIARHFACFGGALLERVHLLAGRDAGFDIRIDGLEPLCRLLETGRGCVLLGSHHGSFEVLRTVARAAPVPVRPVMYRRNAGALTALLGRLAPGLRDSVIEIGEPGAMLRAKEAVERGEMVGLLADRSPHGERVVTVPFLGGKAAFPAGPFVLAATLGAPVVLFYGLRLGPGRYLVRFLPFADRLELRRASREADLRQWIARYASVLEEHCRSHPYNWFNFFPFWEPDRNEDADPPTGCDPAVGRGCGELPRLAAAAPIGPGRAASADGTAAQPLRLAAIELAELEAQMRRMAAVPERRALFREEKRLAALSQPLVSAGRLHYRRPSRLEKRTETPVAERFMVDGNRVELDTADEARRSFDLSQAPELAALVEAIRAPLAGDLFTLQRHFQARFAGTAARWQLDLAPVDPSVARFLRQVLLSGAGTDVLETVSVQANGDVFAMQIRPLA